MTSKRVLEMLNKAQTKGAVEKVEIENLPIYLKYKSEKLVEKKISYGIGLVQELINVSAISQAKKIIDELEEMSHNEKYLGAIFEKRGWIADLENRWNNEIVYFQKARKIYETVPGSMDVEGHKDDRILTVEHFIGRALYFRGRKSDLLKCEKLFTDNLIGYKKLKHKDAIGFNYSWLARTYLAMKKMKKAEEMTKLAIKYLNKTGNETYSYRIMAEIDTAQGKKEKAIQNALESLRHALPAGTNYNSVLEAVKLIVLASK